MTGQKPSACRYDTVTRVSDEIFLCRKINYGNNGNFTRYEPVRFPTKRDLKTAVLAVLDCWKKREIDRETTGYPETECRSGKTIDFFC